ncbi:MAG: hypothetical protein HJJLKODD_01708 [Phycisphaerae bacterium]|nr:hypothetical protein [Phycisphaerae bacterium]
MSQSNGHILVRCRCGRTHEFSPHYAGKNARCKYSGHRFIIPTFEEAQAGPVVPEMGPNCPQCRQPLPEEAIICVRCGYDTRSGRTTPSLVVMAYDLPRTKFPRSEKTRRVRKPLKPQQKRLLLIGAGLLLLGSGLTIGYLWRGSRQRADEQQLWAAVTQSSGTTQSDLVHDYLELHPRGSHIDIAREMAEQQQAADQAAWQKVQTVQSQAPLIYLDQLGSYLQQFPSGLHVDEAQSELDKQWQQVDQIEPPGRRLLMLDLILKHHPGGPMASPAQASRDAILDSRREHWRGEVLKLIQDRLTLGLQGGNRVGLEPQQQPTTDYQRQLQALKWKLEYLGVCFQNSQKLGVPMLDWNRVPRDQRIKFGQLQYSLEDRIFSYAAPLLKLGDAYLAFDSGLVAYVSPQTETILFDGSGKMPLKPEYLNDPQVADQEQQLNWLQMDLVYSEQAVLQDWLIVQQGGDSAGDVPQGVDLKQLVDDRQWEAIWSLGPRVRQVVPVLINNLQALPPEEINGKMELLQILARLGTEGRDAIPTLLPLLNSESTALQTQAFIALCSMVTSQDDAAIMALLDCWKDQENPARRNAFLTELVKIGPLVGQVARRNQLNVTFGITQLRLVDNPFNNVIVGQPTPHFTLLLSDKMSVTQDTLAGREILLNFIPDSVYLEEYRQERAAWEKRGHFYYEVQLKPDPIADRLIAKKRIEQPLLEAFGIEGPACIHINRRGLIRRTVYQQHRSWGEAGLDYREIFYPSTLLLDPQLAAQAGENEQAGSRLARLNHLLGQPTYQLDFGKWSDVWYLGDGAQLHYRLDRENDQIDWCRVRGNFEQQLLGVERGQPYNEVRQILARQKLREQSDFPQDFPPPDSGWSVLSFRELPYTYNIYFDSTDPDVAKVVAIDIHRTGVYMPDLPWPVNEIASVKPAER